MQTILKADEEYKDKSSDFDCAWILEKVKLIVLRLVNRSNLRVSLCDAIANHMLIKRQSYEKNDGCLIRFKSMVETLKISYGKHVLVSEMM